MASFDFKIVLNFLLSWIAWANLNSWLRWRRVRRWGKQHGCGEAPTLPNRLPWGMERIWFLITHGKDLDFLELVREGYDNMQCYTYRIHGFFFTSLVTTTEPENIQAILATRFSDYDLGPARNDAFNQLLGNGIFTADGKAWAHFRQQLKPQFTRDQVSDLDAAERHLHILFQTLPAENGAGWVESVDWMPLLYRFTLDASTEFLFGQSVDSQTTALRALEDSGAYSAEQQQNMAFARAVADAQDHVVARLRFRALAYLPMSKAYKESCAVVRAMADRFVTRALDPRYERKDGADGAKRKFVLLDALVAETRDPVELRDQTLHILLAGRDTTSALLGWTILLLARHPAEFGKLRRSVLAHFGTETQPAQELTFASLKACSSMTRVLYETLRLYPIVPLNGRLATRDTLLPTGGGPDRKQPIVIRRGESVAYSAYAMHRRKDIWGENADVFKPDRWEGRKLGWDFLGFSGGPRVCIGQQYALNEASFFMVRVLQRYDVIEALDMKGPLKKSLTITLQPGDGVKVRMHRACS